MAEAGTGAALAPEAAALVALSAALAAGSAERVEVTLRKAAEAAGRERVEEALLQSYLFVGFPAALNAWVRWRALAPGEPARVEGPDPSAWGERGEAVSRTVYGRALDELRRNVASLHPDLEAWMIHEGYGKVLARPGLPLTVRELCIVGLLVPQDAPRQLHSHLRGALNAGVPEVGVEAALAVALEEVETGPEALPGAARRRAREVWSRVRARHRKRRQDGDQPLEER